LLDCSKQLEIGANSETAATMGFKQSAKKIGFKPRYKNTFVVKQMLVKIETNLLTRDIKAHLKVQFIWCFWRNEISIKKFGPIHSILNRQRLLPS